MVYGGEFCANLVAYRFCGVLSHKKWTLVMNDRNGISPKPNRNRNSIPKQHTFRYLYTLPMYYFFNKSLR